MEVEDRLLKGKLNFVADFDKKVILQLGIRFNPRKIELSQNELRGRNREVRSLPLRFKRMNDIFKLVCERLFIFHAAVFNNTGLKPLLPVIETGGIIRCAAKNDHPDGVIRDRQAYAGVRLE